MLGTSVLFSMTLKFSYLKVSKGTYINDNQDLIKYVLVNRYKEIKNKKITCTASLNMYYTNRYLSILSFSLEICGILGTSTANAIATRAMK